MNLNTFQEILHQINTYAGHTKDIPSFLEKKYPNIVSNEVQKITRKNHYKFVRNSDDIYKAYIEERERQENGKTKMDRKKIVKLAYDYEVPATLVVRMILSRFLEKEENDKVIKPSKKAISEMMLKPHLIEDVDLSLETYWCVLYDDFYSPIGDIIKNQMGYEYECKLRYHCTLEKFAFKDENSLKKEGYDKTPDIKLELPVMINGSPIMWIESKALFADEEIHRTYIKDQYDCYWNRWGPGLVIYWFGFTEDIINTPEKRFVVMDQFPKSEDITPFNCGILDSKIIEEMKVLSCVSYGTEENWDDE